MLNRYHHIVIGFAVSLISACGCNNASPTPAATPPAATQEDHAVHDHEDHAASDDSDIANALASLSAEDRAVAEKQKMCLVGGEPLGSMGAPVKVTVQGRDVFVCCEGCTDALKADPDKFLAKLPQE